MAHIISIPVNQYLHALHLTFKRGLSEP